MEYLVMVTPTKPRKSAPTDQTAKPELKPRSPVCQCQMCGDYFSGPSVFDKHLLGVEETRCRTKAERLKAGMIQNEHGVWLKGGKAQD